MQALCIRATSKPPKKHAHRFRSRREFFSRHFPHGISKPRRGCLLRTRRSQTRQPPSLSTRGRGLTRWCRANLRSCKSNRKAQKKKKTTSGTRRARSNSHKVVPVAALARHKVPLLPWMQPRLQYVGLQPVHVRRIFQPVLLEHAECVAAEDHGTIVKLTLVHVLVAHALWQLHWRWPALKHKLVVEDLLL